MFGTEAANREATTISSIPSDQYHLAENGPYRNKSNLVLHSDWNYLAMSNQLLTSVFTNCLVLKNDVEVASRDEG